MPLPAQTPSKITISDLTAFYSVGVTEEERSTPQKLLLTVEMAADFSSAILSDRIEKTINYHDVALELQKFGDGRSWKLIEKLAGNMADFIMARYKPQAVSIEVKKFPIPEAQYVSVTITRARPRL
jgi:dihydroneopterin aldolase